MPNRAKAAAKHAEATQVVLQLVTREVQDVEGAGASMREIELTVVDDGRAGERAVRSGMGLLGMRERVASLGGRFAFEARPGGGSALRVVIPGVTALARPEDGHTDVECAA